MDVPEITADEPEERKEQLKQAAREHKRELDKEQQDIKAEIASEHGGSLVETKCNIAGDYTATIRTKRDGQLINRLSDIESEIQAFEQGAVDDMETVQRMERVADTACTLLDDVIADPEYNKDLFYNIYIEEGLETLGELLDRVFSAIEAEQERQQGAVDGFRTTD